jgi:hypothetical protein
MRIRFVRAPRPDAYSEREEQKLEPMEPIAASTPPTEDFGPYSSSGKATLSTQIQDEILLEGRVFIKEEGERFHLA